MNSSQVQITGDAASVGGTTVPLSQLRQVEVGRGENLLRSLIIFALCCLAPIAGMVTARQIMDIPLCIAVSAFLFACPFLGIILSALWKKPWAVIAELPTRYETLARTRDRAEAEAIVERLRGAIRH